MIGIRLFEMSTDKSTGQQCLKMSQKLVKFKYEYDITGKSF